MKNNYKKLQQLITETETAISDVKRVANLRAGIISGGPSISEENAALDLAASRLSVEVEAMLTNGARLSKIEDMLRDASLLHVGEIDPILVSFRSLQK